MNIGIDVDETITAMPAFFGILAKAFRVTGNKVYIISYRPTKDYDETMQLLADLGIEHDGLFLSDEPENIGVYKARMARELDLDVFIDDMPEALIDMPPKVNRIWLCDPLVYDLKAVVEKLGTEILNF